MAIKKSQLYASLWQMCDELRGGMDASQYKDYILTLLFMKYVSDKAERNPYEIIQVPEGGSFADMVALRGDLRLRVVASQSSRRGTERLIHIWPRERQCNLRAGMDEYDTPRQRDCRTGAR